MMVQKFVNIGYVGYELRRRVPSPSKLSPSGTFFLEADKGWGVAGLPREI